MTAPTPGTTILRAVSDLRSEADYLRALLAELLSIGQPDDSGGLVIKAPPDLTADAYEAVHRPQPLGVGIVFRTCGCGCGGLR